MFQRYFNVLMISLVIMGGCTNKNSIKSSQSDYDEVYLETEYPIVGCGNIFYAYAFKFKSAKNDSSMIGIIRCPDGYGDHFFKQGEKYKIKYTDKQIVDSIKGYSLTNPFSEFKLSTYLITNITKATH